MPQTVNERLLNSTIRHRVDVQRYGSGVMNRVSVLLREAEEEIGLVIRRRADETWTSRRLKAILRELKEISDENYRKVASRVRDEMDHFALAEADEVSHVLGRDLPAKFSITQPSPQQLAMIVSDEPIVVGPDGALLFEEIFTGLAGGRTDKIKKAIRLGMLEGESNDEMARRLVGTRANGYNDGIISGNRRGALAMVRTMVNHVSNRAAGLTYYENQDIIKGEQWVSTLDTRTTPICRARDGKVFPIGEGPRPPAHINCRSFIVPILKSWEEMGIAGKEIPESTRASMNGQVPAKMTYADWLRANPELAKEILGPARAKMFLQGGLTLDHFVDDYGKTLNLEQIRERRSRY